MSLSDAMLSALRQEGDPAADQLIEGLIERGEVKAANAILADLMQNDQPIPAELPLPLQEWLAATGNLPTWAEREPLERGARLFAKHGVIISLVLSASLVRLYACKSGVKVLANTYRLDQDAFRRIGETAQFVLNVMAPGGLFSGGSGIPSIQKVRLMHAAIRSLVKRSGRWRPAEWGVPICQEDLLGTLMTFSYTVIMDLRKLGIPVGEQEAEDYLYAWRVIGEMMGVRPDIIPTDMKQAAEVTRRIFTRHQGPSPEGVRMTKALLSMQAHLMPGRRLDGSIPAVLRYLVGDQVADWMQIPRSAWDPPMRHLTWLGRLFHRLQPRSRRMGAIVHLLGLEMLNRRAIALAGYRRAAFTIPTSLRQEWGLEPEP